MDSAIINEAIIACLTEIHARLSEAARIAKAAEACPIYEASRLQDATSLLNRLSQG